MGVLFNLLLLGTFKYGNFLVENINLLLNTFQISPLKNPGIILPLGISFFTFQAMSYLMDVYRKETTVQKNLFQLALYISFFPQLIAGPIVRYHDLAPQLLSRKESTELFKMGIERLVIGLVKKVIIANQFAIIAKEAFQIPVDVLPQQLAWAGMISYSFQIYFDFSGYSDMAIGLGMLFGFRLPENFNYPYTTTSIRKFWKNWHITLGQWLMDYLYVPLGGNRKSKLRTYFNLLIVFTVCGFWHGANWNFLLWGLVHGAFMAIERLWFEEKVLNKAGKIIPVVYTFTIATFAWVFFETNNIEHTFGFFKVLFAGNPELTGSNYLGKLLHSEFLLIAIPSILGSFGLFKWMDSRLKIQYPTLSSSNLIYVIKIMGLLLSMAIITILLISDSYNPFIYFRF
ncbi:MAG: MBOAT family protein [Prolixibacteraceae bacterium]|nr:MBOAT family protein [Prolixibacteraceae bacterium]